jgi:acyl transferase domain-containing protein/acyl carrier protein
MAGRFPGAADIHQFWQNLIDGVESISFFDEEELLANGVSRRDLEKPNYVRAAPILEDVALFDAGYFGIGSREAQVLDPQFRVFLEVCGTALQHAGIDPARTGGRIGVYAGSRANTYFEDNVSKNAAVFRATGYIQSMTANHTDYLSTSIAYRLGLTGPAISMVTACSTSLVAVHSAARALRGGECEVALAGGVEISLPVITGYAYADGGMLSPDGHVRTFDAKARGTVFGNGAGAVVLKRLSDALADRDNVLAVVLGSAINNDGSAKRAFTEPSSAGQVAVIEAAIRDAGVDPARIGYIEAHGTGTAVGDPVEVSAIGRAFAGYTDRKGFCAISSVKPNVGHLGAAAGIAGLIKAVHCVREGMLPPSINLDELNPKIDFEHSAVRVNTQLASWPGGESGRLAGVSSFGVGGTNAHLIIGQGPAEPPVPRSARPLQLVALSARTEQALQAATEQLGAHLAGRSGDLDDAAFTLTRGRAELPVRRFVVAADCRAAAAALDQPPPSTTARVGGGVAFLFPGQGAQYPGMAAGLYASESAFRAVIDHCADVLAASHGLDLVALLYRSDADQLSRTACTQPALFAVEYALACALQAKGIRPAAMAGHSIGEYVAAALAGVMDPDDALHLVAERGALMQSLPTGAMAAVTLPEDLLIPMLSGGPDGVDIAAVNAPGVCVVSGSHEAVATLTDELTMQGVAVRPLHTSHAFHSRMLDPVLGTFGERVAAVGLSVPAIPYVSNLTGTWVSDDEATDPGYWVRHLRECVRFSDTLRLLTGDGNRVLVEVGPGRTLAGLVAAHDKDAVAVPTMRHPQQQRDDIQVFLEAIGQVWAAGGPVDWDSFWADEPRQKVALPTYPFQRERYWVDPDANAGSTGDGPDGTGPFTVPAWRETAPPAAGPVDPAVPWLVFAPLGSPALTELVRLVRQAGADVQVAHHGADQAEVIGRIADGKPDRVIVVHALTAAPRPSHVSEADYAPHCLEHGFYSALTTLQLAARTMPGTPVEVLVVTSQMQDVLGDGQIEPAKAAVIGLAKLARKEFESVTCRSVDTDAVGAAALVAGQLFAEVTSGSADEQVAYRGRKRWTWSYAGVELADPGGLPARLKRGGVYVITGGLGGLGLLLARQLADMVAAKIVLVGRRTLPPRQEWPGLVSSPASDAHLRDKIQGVLDAEAVGGEVLILAGDVTSAESIRAVKRSAEAAFGAVDGVFHLAGVAAGGMLETRSRQDADAVIAPKVHGTYVVEQVFRPELFVLYSSLAAISGDFGLGDYVGANAVLDAFAQARWAEGRNIVSVNWPPFLGTGMASSAASRTSAAAAHTNGAGLAPGDASASNGAAAGDAGAHPGQEPAHPLLRDRRELADGTISFGVTLSGDEWVLGDHRMGGTPSYPGTGIVELVRAAFAEVTGEPTAEITNLRFDMLLMVAPGLTARLDLVPDQDGYRVALTGSDGMQYSSARIAGLQPGRTPAVHDMEAERARCPDETALAFEYSLGPLSFGARWWLNATRHSADRRELVDLRLAEEFAADTARYYLHPALLDWSVVLGQEIIADTQRLPFGYEKIVVYGPLPSAVTAVVSHRDDGTGDVTVADVLVLDDTGTERVAIEGFMLVRTAVQGVAPPPAARSADIGPVDPTIADSAVLSSEGEQALRLVLASGCVPQVIWCPEGLRERLRKSGAITRSAILASRAAEGAAQAERDRATPYTAPANGTEHLLAGLWAEVIGVDRVGADDDFFDLGGNSLIAVQLVARMTQKLKTEVSVAMVFDARTVRGLAAAIGVSADGPAPPPRDLQAVPAGSAGGG